MTDFIIIAVVAAIIAAAAGYVYKEKKNGAKCIGCPSGGCASCSCGCGREQNTKDSCCH